MLEWEVMPYIVQAFALLCGSTADNLVRAWTAISDGESLVTLVSVCNWQGNSN